MLLNILRFNNANYMTSGCNAREESSSEMHMHGKSHYRIPKSRFKHLNFCMEEKFPEWTECQQQFWNSFIRVMDRNYSKYCHGRNCT